MPTKKPQKIKNGKVDTCGICHEAYGSCRHTKAKEHISHKGAPLCGQLGRVLVFEWGSPADADAVCANCEKRRNRFQLYKIYPDHLGPAHV